MNSLTQALGIGAYICKDIYTYTFLVDMIVIMVVSNFPSIFCIVNLCGHLETKRLCLNSSSVTSRIQSVVFEIICTLLDWHLSW